MAVGRLKELHNSFVAEGNDVKQAKVHGNVVHKPLVSGDDDEKILNVLIPPENHLLTSVVGKVILEIEGQLVHPEARGALVKGVPQKREMLESFLSWNKLI